MADPRIVASIIAVERELPHRNMRKRTKGWCNQFFVAILSWVALTWYSGMMASF